MARFRATIKGQRGEASRLCSTKSGLSARINGWDAGIRVSAYQNDKGADQFLVYVTGGSHAAIPESMALVVTVTHDGRGVSIEHKTPGGK